MQTSCSFFLEIVYSFKKDEIFDLTFRFNLASNENRSFSFGSHSATVERRKVVIQPAYCRTVPCLKKYNLKNIGLI